jgi:hypothetical protein
MKASLCLPNGLFEELMSHLLPRGSLREEAAFLFVTCERTNQIRFQFQDMQKLTTSDFDAHENDYLELHDETRARLIKRAHDLSASLVELHSHPGPWPAAFSLADRIGLAETVPHMWWRLSKRPYLALVAARSGFDALLWLDDPKIPRALDTVVAGESTLFPTNNSLLGWQ